jgi:hypothetical protein
VNFCLNAVPEAAAARPLPTRIEVA